MTETNYYDWVPFFKGICSAILSLSAETGRDHLLFLKAEQVFDDDPILRFDYVDPFSFIYAFAQRSTKNQRLPYFQRAKLAFNLSEDIPTDYTFPTPIPQTKSLFYAAGEYINNAGSTVDRNILWTFFGAVFRGEPLEAEDFETVLSIKNVGVIKLTQALFLINPKQFIPFDSQMNCLPLPELDNLKPLIRRIEQEGLAPYMEVLSLLKTRFSGCKMYEINLLNVLTTSPHEDYLRVSNNYCQISTNVNGQNEGDHFDEFKKESAVRTGGPAGLTGAQVYPLMDFDRGDIVLIRRGGKRMGGIGIILHNGYLQGGYNEDAVIRIIWLVKQERHIKGTILAQRIGFDYPWEGTMNGFKNLYPEIFGVLDYLRNKQKIMINHALNKHKNFILSGPPGTGKTRYALQIARWLTRGTDHEVSLLEAIDKKLIKEEPDIEDIEEAELIQFHPSYSYEDFVRGIAAKPLDGKISYVVENKCLAKLAETAAQPDNATKAYVLIIDEINRANLSSVLGELIYALEYRGKAVHTLYKFGDSDRIVLPPNLYVIGTMNTADRSIGHIDYAIRRRFSFVPVLPDPSTIKEPAALALYNQVAEIFKKFTAPDFDVNDVQIGHSYFLVTSAELPLRLKYEILPLLLEYLRDGVLLLAAEKPISALHV